MYLSVWKGGGFWRNGGRRYVRRVKKRELRRGSSWASVQKIRASLSLLPASFEEKEKRIRMGPQSRFFLETNGVFIWEFRKRKAPKQRVKRERGRGNGSSDAWPGKKGCRSNEKKWNRRWGDVFAQREKGLFLSGIRKNRYGQKENRTGMDNDSFPQTKTERRRRVNY